MIENVIHAVVKRTSPTRKQAHVILPEFLLGKRVSVTLLNKSGSHEAYARVSGNSAHVYVDFRWLGEPVKVEVIN